METPPIPEPSYGLRRHPDEQSRLMTKARLEQRQLERCFTDAGLAAGMTVLDVGCGPGDVSLTAAGLVGPTGRVIGVDADPAMIATARERTTAQGLSNVTFLTSPLESLVLDTMVDAIVGRKILIWLPRPDIVLRHLAASLRPGGVVAFIEHDFGADPLDAPPVPLLTTSRRWAREYFRQSGLDPSTGRNLHHTFLGAGLEAPEQRLECRFFSGPDASDYETLATTMVSALPQLIALGIATAEEIGIATYAARLRDQVVSLGAVCDAIPLVSAWARKPLMD